MTKLYLNTDRGPSACREAQTVCLSEDRLLVALETLELAAAEQAQRQQTLERKARPTQDERLELKVLRRNAACLGSLRRFEATAEAVDERGRRRLWRLGGVPAGWRR